MRKLLYTTLLFISFLTAKAQLILPEFYPAEKQEAFSSDNEENVPLLFNNGTGIYYNMTYIEGFENKTRVVGQDIWFSKIGEDGWENPYRLFRERDLEGQNLIVGTSLDGKRIYLFNTVADRDTVIRKLVYIDNQKKDKWHDPVEVIIPGLEFGKSYINFYVNPQETVILISKPPLGNDEDEDVFVSLKKEDGTWGELINVGKPINTNRFELASYISEDLKALYFSSEGHGGYGSSDIFVSYRLDDTWENWTNPLNMGGGINSSDYEAFFIMATPTEVYFTSNRNSNHSNIYKCITTGQVVFANADSIYGEFAFKSLPAEGINLRIENEDGELIDKVLTDDKGRFKFAKLSGDESFFIRVDNEDDELYVGSKIYFLDGNNVKTKRYIYTEEGLFVNSRDIKGGSSVRGIFNYENLPSMMSGLVIYDENGFPLDTIITDDKGIFNYSILKYDDGFSIAPLNMTEDDFINVGIHLLDDDGNRIQTLIPGKFNSIKSLKKDKTTLTTLNDEPHIDDKKYTKRVKQEAEAWNGMAEGDRSIYFDFNQKVMPKKEGNKLALLISILKNGPETKAMLTGHTDNKGSESLNTMFGLSRAKDVKKYLISKGIPKSKIVISSKGMSTPIADNSTEKGQAKNRRVEIKIK
ncbi:MAG: OmpA family protein [Flavobacteriales bacterium]|nr:OmpA family protein [Flavobacteriales bacterium]